MLNRAESAGLLTTELRPGVSGPGRKYLILTDQGHEVLDTQRQDWGDFTRVIASYLANPTGRVIS